MDSTPSLQAEPTPRVPVEVCERIIDAVLDDRYIFVLNAVATLSSCALVCRAWRAPAQKVLFEHAVFRSKVELYQFAELLDASPELGAYVRIVELRGSLHVPDSSVVSFPAVLGTRLTRMSHLYIYGLEGHEKVADSLSDGVKELPPLPIHRNLLPCLSTCASHIRVLSLYVVVFPSFGDFARILNTFSNLQKLCCESVSWVVLGREPLCMAKGRYLVSQKTFLPKLETLACAYMEEHGRRRLLAALGPSLRSLYLKFPDHPSVQTAPSMVEEKDPSIVPDFCNVEHLWFSLASFPEPYDSTLESLKDTLVSWVPSTKLKVGVRSASQRERKLYVAPHRDHFRRAEFVNLLRAIGTVVEAALCRKEASGHPSHDAGRGTENQADPCWAAVVVRNLGDGPEWANWWTARIRTCFPTFAKWRRLRVYPYHNLHHTMRWIDQEQTPDGAPPIPAPVLSSVTAEDPADVKLSQFNRRTEEFRPPSYPPPNFDVRTLD